MLMMFLAKLLMIVAMVLVIIDRLALTNHVHSNIIVDHNQVDSKIVDFHSHGVLGNDREVIIFAQWPSALVTVDHCQNQS